uniref:DNA-directed RNA polymerase III subunit RPC4 n=1 Tax=Graphocephala atropunctata TaxID=36148 RepID=A0A1B6KUG5_9HEMI
MMMKQKENTSQPLGDITIKTEPGTSTTPVIQRLPSLRPPRDLSLSAYSLPNLNQSKNKKVYVPNLNVQRIKPTGNVTVKTDPVKPKLERPERERGRGRKNHIQLNHGVFADGIPGQRNVGRGRPSGGSGDKADNILRKPTLKLKENFKVDKKEEENTMKQLLKDDFIDDPNLEPDFDKCPITLPLLNCKEEGGLKKKSDLKPVDKKEHLTLQDVFCDVTAPDPGFIFMQLPNSMPGLKTESSGDESRHSSQPTTSTSQPTETKLENERCLLKTLPGGQIGKLQILKSGRARLVFGDIKMWLEMGTQVAFKQDLVSVDLDKDTHTGHMMNLGSVNVRMVATPDWEAMMSGAVAPPPSDKLST